MRRATSPSAGRVFATLAFAVLTTTGAKAQDVPGPSPSSSPSPAPSNAPAATDPCGDDNLLATTDRPTFGTNPCVVKDGNSNVEFGYKNTTTSGSPGGTRSVSYPEARERSGILPNLELVLDLPSQVEFGSPAGRIGTDSNFGAGLKYELGYSQNFVHGIAGEVVFPSGTAGGFPSFNGSYQIGGSILPGLGANLTLGFNTFSSPNPAGGKNVTTTSFQPTFIVGGLVAPETKLSVEAALSTSSGPGTSGRYFGNVFLQHQFTKNLLIDIEAAQRFTVVDRAHQHYIGAGGAIKL